MTFYAGVEDEEAEDDAHLLAVKVGTCLHLLWGSPSSNES